MSPTGSGCTLYRRVCLSVRLCLYLSVSVFVVCICVHLRSSKQACVSVCLSVYPSVSVFVCVFVCDLCVLT